MIDNMIARYYQLLKEFVQIQSISTNDEYIPEIKKTSKWLKKIFEENKMDVKIIDWYWNPIIIAEYIHDDKLPTVTIYWNYDIVSAYKKDWRKEDPFSLYIWKENIYWRGVADNKWQILIHMLAIFELIKEKNIWYNIRFLIEWEKITWSKDTKRFIIENKENLKSDFILLSDWNLVNQHWWIWVSTRWDIELQLTIKTSDNNINLWYFWWIVPNAIHELSKLTSKLYWANTQINIPYFYYQVQTPVFDTILRNKKIEFNKEEIQKHLWIKEIFKEKTFDYISQIWLRPTIQITSIHSGSQNQLENITIQNIATANINFKTVIRQNSDNIIKSFQQRTLANLPKYVEHYIYINRKSEPVQINKDNKYFSKAEWFLQEIFHNEPIQLNLGVNIPILDTIISNITDNIIIIPLSNYDSNTNCSNENIEIKLVEKWFLFTLNFLSKQLQLF